jgi:hypothetical protein
VARAGRKDAEVCREYNNVVLLVVVPELRRMVALIAIEDQQPVFALCPRCYIIVELFDSVKTTCIGVTNLSLDPILLGFSIS